MTKVERLEIRFEELQIAQAMAEDPALKSHLRRQADKVARTLSRLQGWGLEDRFGGKTVVLHNRWGRR